MQRETYGCVFQLAYIPKQNREKLCRVICYIRVIITRERFFFVFFFFFTVFAFGARKRILRTFFSYSSARKARVHTWPFARR